MERDTEKLKRVSALICVCIDTGSGLESLLSSFFDYADGLKNDYPDLDIKYVFGIVRWMLEKDLIRNECKEGNGYFFKVNFDNFNRWYDSL